MTNYVAAGDYKGNIHLEGFIKTKMYIEITPGKKGKRKYLTKETVESYEVVDVEEKKSMASGLVRGAIGAAIMGPAGAVAGAVSAKSKTDTAVSVLFKDGTKALIILDKQMYNFFRDDLY